MKPCTVAIYTVAERKPGPDDRVFYYVARVGWCAGYLRERKRGYPKEDKLELTWYTAGEGDYPYPIIRAEDGDLWMLVPDAEVTRDLLKK